MRWQPGSAPEPAVGGHDTPLDFLVSWEGNTPSPVLTLGSSILAPSALSFCGPPPNVKSWLRPCSQLCCYCCRHLYFYRKTKHADEMYKNLRKAVHCKVSYC